MFTSDTKKHVITINSEMLTAIIYLLISILCGVFSGVYEHFSHGVYSKSMIFLFMYPLIGGVFPYLLFSIASNETKPNRVTINLYNSGIATMTVGSLIRGILEIYGTASKFTIYYTVVSWMFILISIAIYFYVITNAKKPPKYTL